MRWSGVLLLIPYAAVLVVPLYNKTTPALTGIPFFYWYQLTWIPLGSLLLFILYLAERRKRHSDT